MNTAHHPAVESASAKSPLVKREAAIDGAPAKLREAARAAADDYLAARKAVDRAYADAFEASLDGGEDR